MDHCVSCGKAIERDPVTRMPNHHCSRRHDGCRAGRDNHAAGFHADYRVPSEARRLNDGLEMLELAGLSLV